MIRALLLQTSPVRSGPVRISLRSPVRGIGRTQEQSEDSEKEVVNEADWKAKVEQELITLRRQKDAAEERAQDLSQKMEPGLFIQTAAGAKKNFNQFF